MSALAIPRARRATSQRSCGPNVTALRGPKGVRQRRGQLRWERVALGLSLVAWVATESCARVWPAARRNTHQALTWIGCGETQQESDQTQRQLTADWSDPGRLPKGSRYSSRTYFNSFRSPYCFAKRLSASKSGLVRTSNSATSSFDLLPPA